MLFARIKAIWLFLLLFIPVTISGILMQLAETTPHKHLRFLTISLNLSTFFAMTFVCWLATLTFILAPTFRARFFVFAGLVIGILFRLWQDSFVMEALNITGQIPRLEYISIDSPVFVMHVLVSLFMIYLLVQLPIWLLKKEKRLDLPNESKAKSILWFFIFPVGIFFLQPRMRKILDAKEIK